MSRSIQPYQWSSSATLAVTDQVDPKRMVSDIVEPHRHNGLRFFTAPDFNAATTLLLTATTARYTHLRDYLEHFPLPSNNNTPLNPNGERRYLIIISHCHYGKLHLLSVANKPL
jgi:hypothetical protein